MKTKNAFAFRDFDSTRILQRPFFRDFHFDTNKSDAQILESLNTVEEDSVDAWERNLYVIKATHERLTQFRHLIDRHNKKKFTAKKVTIELIPYDSKKITPFGAFYFV
jgi:patatin-like phospholipase/acyl hydrolase